MSGETFFWGWVFGIVTGWLSAALRVDIYVNGLRRKVAADGVSSGVDGAGNRARRAGARLGRKRTGG